MEGEGGREGGRDRERKATKRKQEIKRRGWRCFFLNTDSNLLFCANLSPFHPRSLPSNPCCSRQTASHSVNSLRNTPKSCVQHACMDAKMGCRFLREWGSILSGQSGASSARMIELMWVHVVRIRIRSSDSLTGTCTAASKVSKQCMYS